MIFAVRAGQKRELAAWITKEAGQFFDISKR
jgi:hypothetical protein